MKGLKNFIKFQRENVLFPDWREDDDDWEHDSTERKLFYILLRINTSQHYVTRVKSYDDLERLATYYISLYQQIPTIYNKELKENIKILKDLIILNLFKISLISRKNKFDYYEDWKIESLNIEWEFVKSIFSKYDGIFRFMLWKKVSKISFIDEYVQKFENNNISSVWIFLLLKYYKDNRKSSEKLEQIYDLCRRKISEPKKVKKSLSGYLNCLYSWNCYLSFLIDWYKKVEMQIL